MVKQGSRVECWGRSYGLNDLFPTSVSAETEAEETAKENAAMPINRSHELCAYCHQKLETRPASMPQVDPREHLEALDMLAPDEKIEEAMCGACHDGHDPSV